MTQGPSRRLVTEQKLTDTTGLYVPLTQKGAANGVATLGADGKLTPAQAPGSALAYKTAQTQRSTSSTPTLDPDLFATLAVGTHLVEIEALWQCTVTTASIWYKIAGTAAAAQVGFGSSDQPSGGSYTGPVQRDTLVTSINNSVANVSSNAAYYRLRVELVVTVTAAGTLGLQWSPNNTTSTVTVAAGSWLRATKLA